MHTLYVNVFSKLTTLQIIQQIQLETTISIFITTLRYKLIIFLSLNNSSVLFPDSHANISFRLIYSGRFIDSKVSLVYSITWFSRGTRLITVATIWGVVGRDGDGDRKKSQSLRFWWKSLIRSKRYPF